MKVLLLASVVLGGGRDGAKGDIVDVVDVDGHRLIGAGQAQRYEGTPEVVTRESTTTTDAEPLIETTPTKERRVRRGSQR